MGGRSGGESMREPPSAKVVNLIRLLPVLGQYDYTGAHMFLLACAVKHGQAHSWSSSGSKGQRA